MKTEIEKNRKDNKNIPTPENPPNDPDKNIPIKKDDDNDFTKPKPPIIEPGKVDPTRIEEPNKVDPTRIDVPDEPGKQQNMTNKNGKLYAIITILIMSTLFCFYPQTSNASFRTKHVTTANISTPKENKEAQILLNRLEEINLIDKTSMTFSERRKLKKEVRHIQVQLHEISGGVYLSAGALIIILLLLILLA